MYDLKYNLLYWNKGSIIENPIILTLWMLLSNTSQFVSRLHKGDANHLKLSKYHVQPADLVDGLSLCSWSWPNAVAIGVPIDFTVQWSGLVHWLVSSAMLTQTRGTGDVIRCHMVLHFRNGESRGAEIICSLLHPTGTWENGSLTRWNGTDGWIKKKTYLHRLCMYSMYGETDGWITPLPNVAFLTYCGQIMKNESPTTAVTLGNCHEARRTNKRKGAGHRNKMNRPFPFKST